MGRMVGSIGCCHDATSHCAGHVRNRRPRIQSLRRYLDRLDEERRFCGVVLCDLGIFPAIAVSNSTYRRVRD